MKLIGFSFFMLLIGFTNLQAQGTCDTMQKTMKNGIFYQIDCKGQTKEGIKNSNGKQGVWSKSRSRDGKLLSMETFYNNVLNGTSVYFTEENTVSRTTVFVDGKRNGPERTFHIKGGGLKSLAYYTNDKMNGYRKQYFIDGTQEFVEQYKDAKKNGEQIYYYSNAQKAAIYTYAYGGKHGLATFYNRNGYVTSMGNFKSDKKSGPWKEYHDNGELSGMGEYMYGKKTGEWKTFNKRGEYLKIEKF